MSWQYTDETKTVVTRTMEDGTTESCIATRADVVAFVADGGVIDEPLVNVAAALAAYRYSVSISGATIDGIAIQTDPASQSALMGAYIMAAANSGYTVQWKTPSGFVTLTAAQIIALGNGVAAFVQKCFSSESTVTTSLSSYTTTAQVIAAFDAAMSA